MMDFLFVLSLLGIGFIGGVALTLAYLSQR